MTKNVLLSGIICCLASGGLLPQRASAMLPVGNDSHRRFYQEQEWIWTAPERPAASVENIRQSQDSTMPTHPSHTNVAFTMPTHPPQASLAFTMPTHPPQANVAFTMPTHPPQANVAFTMPTHPPQSNIAFPMPTHTP